MRPSSLYAAVITGQTIGYSVKAIAHLVAKHQTQYSSQQLQYKANCQSVHELGHKKDKGAISQPDMNLHTIDGVLFL